MGLGGRTKVHVPSCGEGKCECGRVGIRERLGRAICVGRNSMVLQSYISGIAFALQLPRRHKDTRCRLERCLLTILVMNNESR